MTHEALPLTDPPQDTLSPHHDEKRPSQELRERAHPCSKEQLRPIIDAVDESYLLAEISGVIDSNNSREEGCSYRGGDPARRRLPLGRRLRGDGRRDRKRRLQRSRPPVHHRFTITQGLSGAAVASGETVVAGDVAEDPRYLTAFGSTQSEIIVPVVDSAKRKVVGTIDVESEEKPSEADRAALERCAVGVAGLFET